MRVVLASQSPRRKELLGRIFDEFDIIPANGPEETKAEEPADIVKELSLLKAEEIWDNVMAGADDTGEKCLVIGSDTIVAKDSIILGKPNSMESAKEMIKLLEGDRHQVYTGVTLIDNITGEKRITRFAEKTEVEFGPMSEDEIEKYLAYRDENDKYEWADKAGAYGIQGYCSKHIMAIYGDYYNVMGLPVARIYEYLSKMEIISR